MLVAADARAQEEDRLERAKASFKEAEVQYRLSKFERALRGYQTSYELSKRPALLFNIAQCHARRGRRKQALFYYRLYISDFERQHPGRSVPFREEVEGNIERLEQELWRAEVKATVQHRASSTPTLVEAPRREPSWRRPAGWAALGLGAASLATGVVLSAVVLTKNSEFKQATQLRRTYAELHAIEQSARRFQAGQIATFVAGGVLAAAGGALLLWESRRLRAEQVPSVTPLVGEVLGLQGQLRF
jgi:hypothetical protein